MALNKDVIKANPALAALTDDQVATIVTLSTNDEQTVINTRIGELHGQYDTDVVTVTNIAKNQGEKSYDYVKRVLGEYKTKLDGLATADATITALKADKTALEEKIKTGTTDATVKQALTDATTKLAQLQTLYDTDKAKYESDIATLNNSIQTSKVESHIDAAVAKMKFKAIIPESVRTVLVNAAKAELLSTTKPEFTKEGNVIFRDAANNIMNNPANKLSPYTPEELMSERLKDVLEPVRKAGGAGSEQPGGGAGITVDIASARTQIEADEIIQKQLLADGVLKTDPTFGQQQKKIRDELGVSKLPVR